MRYNIKKIIIVLFTIFLPLIVSANKLNSIVYKNGILTLEFQENVGHIKHEYDERTPSLMIDIPNTSGIRSDVERNIKINDRYVTDLTNDYYNNNVSTVIYLQTGTRCNITQNRNKVQIAFIEAKTLPKKNYTIVLDAGHGGHDSGAIGNGYREKDLALAVTLKLYQNLKRDYNVILTRSNDTFIPLNERAEIGNNHNANLFISIHLNASVNSGAHGTEVYYFEKNPSVYARQKAQYENGFDLAGARSIESNFLVNDILYGLLQKGSSSFANTILNNIVSTMSIKRRKVLGANFAVLRGSRSPSVLVELGFITNYNDVRQYTSEEGQINVANAIANAVRKHF